MVFYLNLYHFTQWIFFFIHILYIYLKTCLAKSIPWQNIKLDMKHNHEDYVVCLFILGPFQQYFSGMFPSHLPGDQTQAREVTGL